MLMLAAQDGINHLTFDAYCENNLWYHYIDQVSEQEYEQIGTNTQAVVRALSNGTAYQLWHHRLGHVSDKIMQEVHKNCIGVPKLKQHRFLNCSSCITGKFKKVHIVPSK
jgi:MarR-like DNA-binding transcriptional regulator SgrR of sgrS sRNA